MNGEREAFLEYWYENNLPYEGDDELKDCAWLAWQASAQRQGYKLVPVDVLERAISHISIAMCHPNNTKNEEDIMNNDMVIIEEAMIGVVDEE